VTPVRSTTRRDIFWRAWLARLTALAFIVQSIGLFMAPAHPAPHHAQAHDAMVMAPDCPHHHGQQDVQGGDGQGDKGHGDKGHGSSDSCPMCQSLGCALGGAILPVLAFGRDERPIGQRVIPSRHVTPDSLVLLPPPARGPPTLI
jgi:hypothetical protein